jgi:hypothetical protein
MSNISPIGVEHDSVVGFSLATQEALALGGKSRSIL